MVAAVMDDGLHVRIDNQIVPYACKTEVAYELGAGIGVPCRARYHLNQDNGVWHFKGLIPQLRSTIDEGIRLVGRVLVNSNRHAIR